MEDVMPNEYKCKCCNKIKPFTNEYFNKQTNSKYGLSYVCKECGNIRRSEYRFKNDLKFTEDNVVAWWTKLYNKEISVMPKYCYKKDNIIKIIRYIVFEVEKINDKYDLIDWFVRKNLEKYTIDGLVQMMGGKVACINICFKEFVFLDDDFKAYNDNKLVKILDEFINKNNIDIYELLNSKSKIWRDKQLVTMIRYYNTNYNIHTNDIVIKYYKIKGIKHPISNREICEFDFTRHKSGFFDEQDNIIKAIKYYCEKCCDDNILECLNDTESLKKWTFKYFNQQQVSKVFGYSRYCNSIYELLIKAYPSIKDNKTLFEWEWTQCNNSNIDFLVKMLREYVLYRMNNIIDSPKDAPSYLNSSYFDIAFPKMNKHITRKRFKNYYEWACLSFPEYKDIWKPEDFNIIISSDGKIFDSYEERDVYEFIKSQPIFKYIKSIGKNRSGKYVFKPNNDKYGSFCPDFVIEYIEIDSKKFKLKKPIILEYYGMYEENHKNIVFKKYKEKTLEKEEFYKNNKDIYYIPIYRSDIKNGYEGLAEKLDLFILENINNYKEGENCE